MKKFTILMAIFIFMANCAMAQDTIPEYSSISIDVTPSYHRYGSQYGCFRLQADFSKYVSNKWAVGAGMFLEGFNDNEFISKADVSLPLNYLHVSTNKFGFFVTASYSTSFGIFMAEAWFGDIGTYISASDDRCRIKVETENGSYITNDYNLSRTDGKEWATNKNGSLALS